ncbi:hypothetical protein ACU635_39130 [[Actinomadura] parvosata]|uniref:hypothetical protein n=1 Tax=[Actinomadura] parvosata TaxID=1955412 RepID=UPI00406BF6FB
MPILRAELYDDMETRSRAASGEALRRGTDLLDAGADGLAAECGAVPVAGTAHPDPAGTVERRYLLDRADRLGRRHE